MRALPEGAQPPWPASIEYEVEHTTGAGAFEKTPRYCWRTRKCRNLCIPHAFLEGKKAWETYARKSTTRTLKLIRQQYPEVIHSPQHLPALSVSRRSLSVRYAQALRASVGPCGNGRMS